MTSSEQEYKLLDADERWLRVWDEIDVGLSNPDEVDLPALDEAVDSFYRGEPCGILTRSS